jgi:radical SAM superfamily enzyme YgiQ (UPF0313 family)
VLDYDYKGLVPVGYDASRECPPYGTYLLASLLRSHGYSVSILDFIAAGSINGNDWHKSISDCDLLGISATTLSWPAAKKFALDAKRNKPDLPIVLGGVHGSLFPEYILATSEIDFVICGEAEDSLPALCRALSHSTDLDKIPGLVWKDKAGIIHSGPKNVRLNSDQLSSGLIPDYRDLPEGRYKGLSIESSRGCPFNCSFCSATYRSCWMTYHPTQFVDNVEQMLPFLNKTKLGFFYIVDDEFTNDHKRCIAIANELRKRNISAKFTFDARANDLLHEPFLDSFQEYTKQLLVGAECGYDEGLRRIGKGTNTGNIEAAAKLLAKYGLAQNTDFSFIIGLPWETQEQVMTTIDFANRLLCEYGVRILLQWYLQMPGARLWADYRNKELVHEAMYDKVGFFRNLYLFRLGNQLSPTEMWDISQSIHVAKVLSRLKYQNKQMIEHSLPLPIYSSFPRIRYNH